MSEVAIAETQGCALDTEHAAALALVAEHFGSDVWKKIDDYEKQVESLPSEMLRVLPLNHVFTPGLYLRECCMRAGEIITTRIHLTDHPFIVSLGCVSVLNDSGEWEKVRAPYTGVTKKGTRRIIVVHEDCIWTTCHANPQNKTDPDEIVRDVTFTGGKFSELRGAAAQPALPETTPK